MNILPLKQTMEEVFDEFQRGTILKCVDENGKIIGSVRAYEENGTANISKLMVHPKQQRRGNNIGIEICTYGKIR